MYGVPYKVVEYEIAKWFQPAADCVDVTVRHKHILLFLSPSLSGPTHLLSTDRCGILKAHTTSSMDLQRRQPQVVIDIVWVLRIEIDKVCPEEGMPNTTDNDPQTQTIDC
jgi:hypothetical protein